MQPLRAKAGGRRRSMVCCENTYRESVAKIKRRKSNCVRGYRRNKKEDVLFGSRGKVAGGGVVLVKRGILVGVWGEVCFWGTDWKEEREGG